MPSTAQLRSLWAPACSSTKVLTLWTGVRISVDPRALEAFRALDMAMQAAGYQPRAGQTGAYNCRKITGGSGYSLHAYGIALDVNWNANPYRADGRLVTDMPASMVRNIEAIRTKAGVKVFEWGGRWSSVKDAMHYELDLSPAQLAVGIDWSTVPSVKLDPDRPGTWPVLEDGDTGPTVEELQRRLNAAGASLEVDGDYGTLTLAAVEAFQRSRKLTVDGIVGEQTWTALLTAAPADPPASPVKLPEEAPVPDGPYPDVPADHTFAAEVARARELGIMHGKADGTFGLGEPVTREVLAAVAVRILDR